MHNKTLLKPFVKWVGGKRQLINEIQRYIPKDIGTYYEPFVGGGAVLFALQPGNYVVNDSNAELINIYQVLRDDVEGLIKRLRTYPNNEKFFYMMRNLDRMLDFKNLNAREKAARTLYLNKTCYNGLYRVNRQGQFNTPFGRYKNPLLIDVESLRANSRYLKRTRGKILNKDFEEAVKDTESNSFVYLDPPYDPVSQTSFTQYTSEGFDRAEQIRLKAVCDTLNQKNTRFLLSNSSTRFIHNLYKHYKIEIIKARRNINSAGNGRGLVDEVLIRNYN